MERRWLFFVMELKAIKLFNELGQEELEEVKRRARVRVYPKGSTVFVGGQEADGLYIIMKGRAKVLMLYPDGREKTLAILLEGEVLGEVTLYGSDLRSATVETLETTTFLVISRDSFRILLLAMPRLSFRVIELLSERLRRANQQIEELTFLNARSRVISGLIFLAEEHGCAKGKEIHIPFSMTHAELARMVAVSRETVTKVLNELQSTSCIGMGRGQIKILSMSGLRRQSSRQCI